ncbi:MAG: DUF4270 family protein [Imperialibacter sp.]|uniref:DUF4270 family protein n=1 Tax=Imperialibacter sp. TaxID=2038411 RepID=UPI0032EAA4C7
MNLQGRTASGLLFGAALMLFGCESPSEVGLELNPNENNVGVYEEVFTLPSSVILFDSINTTNDSRLLVGRFKDPFFGDITAKSFSQVTRNGELIAINDKGVLDSIMFDFELSYIYGEYGSTFQTINVYQLSDTLYSGVSYYSDDSTKYLSRTPAASKKFFYSPTKDTVIRIKATPAWASNFFSIVRNGTTVSELENEIKGFALIPGADNTLIFGFHPENSKVSVHYHVPDGADSLVYSLNFGATVRYNGVTADRAGTELGALVEQSDEFIPPSGHMYLQGGTGIYTKLSLRPFRKFVDSLGNIIVNRAEIRLGAIDELTSVDYRIMPPNSFMYIFADSTNKIIGANIGLSTRIPNHVVLSDVSYGNPSSPRPLFPLYDSASRAYSSTPTFFFQALRDSIFNTNDLIIYPGTNDVTSLNRFVVPKDSIQLKIYYTRLQ